MSDLVPYTPPVETRLFDDQHPVRVATDAGEPWVMGQDLAAPLGVKPDAIRQQIRDLEPSDVRVISIHTNKGPRNATFLSRSGAYQIIMQSRKPVAKRLRKWLADLGVAFEDGKLAPAAPAGISKSDILEIATTLIPVLTQALSQALQPRTALAADTRKRVDLENLPVWSDEEYATMKRQRQLVYVPEFLLQETGEKPRNAAALTKRIISFCKEREMASRKTADRWQVYPYQHHGSIRYLVPLDAAKLVYRSGWTKRNPVDVLAPRLADVIDLDERRSS